MENSQARMTFFPSVCLIQTGSIPLHFLSVPKDESDVKHFPEVHSQHVRESAKWYAKYSMNNVIFDDNICCFKLGIMI